MRILIESAGDAPADRKTKMSGSYRTQYDSGRVAVFDTFDAALDFARRYRDARIFGPSYDDEHDGLSDDERAQAVAP